MELLRLPNKILLDITSFLHTRDIYALIRTSHDLYNALNSALYYSSGRYKQPDALLYAVENNNIVHVRSALCGLRVAPRRYKALPGLPPCCHQLSTELEELEPEKIPKYLVRPIWPVQYDEETNGWSECCSRVEDDDHSRRKFWQEFSKHPLYQNGYTMKSIINIQNPLIIAIQERHFKLVELLLKYGTRPNFYSEERPKLYIPDYAQGWWYGMEITEPPLCAAVKSGDVDIITLIFEYGAQPDLYPPSPLYLAVEKGKLDVISRLLRYRVRPQGTSLKLGVLRDNIFIVKYLLDEGLDAHEYGSSSLYSAQMKGDQEMVDLLESRGAKITGDSFDKEKWAEEDNDGKCHCLPRWWGCPEMTGGIGGIEEEITEDEEND